MSDKSFDIILIGATGFTGQRAAKYLRDNAPESLKWGIAARNPEKISDIAQSLSVPDDHQFIVDTTKKDQVESVVQQTKIIITTVGPFSLYGEEVIAACAKFGTHYLDITGEVGFIKKMKEKYEEKAQKTGALLVPFSGFDSVPADLAAMILSEKFNHPKKLSIKSYYSISGGFNGGTIATMLNKFETGEYREMTNPKLLIENSSQKVHKPNGAQFFGYDSEIRRWSAPFIMGAINSKVVYKSADDNNYAESIAYSEHSSLGKWFNPIPFFVVSLIVLSISIFGPKAWFRKILKKIMPAPGEGPSEAQIENGYFKLSAFARDENQATASLKMSFPGDPGNKATVFFLCESALCLFKSLEDLELSGFKTSSTAFGKTLFNRLTERGLDVDVIE